LSDCSFSDKVCDKGLDEGSDARVLVVQPSAAYIEDGFGRAENRFPRINPGEEESPNTKGRDAA